MTKDFIDMAADAIDKDRKELDEYRKIGSLKQVSKMVKEEDVPKFYYDIDFDRYLIGTRTETFYYGQVDFYPAIGRFATTWCMSRYLPWETKEYPYREPKEIPFDIWLSGLVKKQFSKIAECSECFCSDALIEYFGNDVDDRK